MIGEHSKRKTKSRNCHDFHGTEFSTVRKFFEMVHCQRKLRQCQEPIIYFLHNNFPRQNKRELCSICIEQQERIRATMSSSHTIDYAAYPNKKRKEPDSVSSDNDDIYLEGFPELGIASSGGHDIPLKTCPGMVDSGIHGMLPLKRCPECESKDKKIKELEKVIETLKAQANENSGCDDDDDDFSDSELEELDASDPWNSMYLQLREYRIDNGNCNVPSSAGKLNIWVKNQKQSYNNVRNSKKGNKITPERIAMLEGLGIHWGKKYPAPPSWDEQFAVLQKRKEAMGHCNVHVGGNNPSPIAKWVSTQRFEYKLFRKGRNSLLTLEQIGQLKDLGFKWKN